MTDRARASSAAPPPCAEISVTSSLAAASTCQDATQASAQKLEAEQSCAAWLGELPAIQVGAASEPQQPQA